MNIFVQGDRDAKGIERQVTELGRIVAEESRRRDTTLWLGSAGRIVGGLTCWRGARCVVHQISGKENVAELGSNVTVVECDTWGTRMDRFLEADGYIFFSGGEGTMAHLMVAIAHVKKADVQQGKRTPPRRIALVDWSTPMVAAVMTAMRIQSADIDYWFANCSIEEAFEFVTAGPK